MTHLDEATLPAEPEWFEAVWFEDARSLVYSLLNLVIPDALEDDRHRVGPAPNVNAVAARVHVGVRVTQRDARLL